MEPANRTWTSPDQASPPLESIIGWTWRDRIRHVWHRLLAQLEEMNYAALQIVERNRFPQ